MTLGTVLVGGGTGFVGTALCKLLRRKGYGVTMVSRMPGPLSISWHDLKNCGLPEQTTAVVNLAGQNVMDPTQRWTAGFKQNVYNSRINTTKALARAIQKAHIKPNVFVCMSGVGIYEPHQDTEYSEDSKVIGYDFLSKMCHDLEEAAQSAGVCRSVRVRSGVVLGRHGGMIEQLYMPFYMGLGGPVMPGNQYLPWIHLQDLCRLLVFAIENDKVSGVINGVAPHVITNREFSDAFAHALRRPALIPVPKFFLNMIFNEERAIMLTAGQKVIPKKTQMFGFQYHFPKIEDACREVVNAPPKGPKKPLY